MSYKIVDRVFDVRGLTVPERVVLFYLARDADSPNRPPTVQYLADMLGCHMSTIQRILRVLEEKGLISSPCGKHGGRGKPTDYQLHLPVERRQAKITPFRRINITQLKEIAQ